MRLHGRIQGGGGGKGGGGSNARCNPHVNFEKFQKNDKSNKRKTRKKYKPHTKFFFSDNSFEIIWIGPGPCVWERICENFVTFEIFEYNCSVDLYEWFTVVVKSTDSCMR